MATFCMACGAPITGGAFCVKCGAANSQATSPSPATPSPSVAPVRQTAAPTASAASAKGSPLVKILIGIGVVLIGMFAIAAAGVYYVAHRVSNKVPEIADELPSDPTSGSFSRKAPSNGASTGSGSVRGIDACRLLSKEDVASAIGVDIVLAQSGDNSCSYMAKGSSGDMTAKHMTAMAAAKGADAQQQKMIRGIAGGLFNSLQSEHPNDSVDSNGNVPVLSFSIDGHGEEQMSLNTKVLSSLGASQVLTGLGDQAFDEAGAMMLVRKGDKLIRIMYSTCPCNTEAIKPLAGRIADRL